MTQKLDCYYTVYRLDICEKGANKSRCRHEEMLAVNENAGKSDHWFCTEVKIVL